MTAPDPDPAAAPGPAAGPPDRTPNCDTVLPPRAGAPSDRAGTAPGARTGTALPTDAVAQRCPLCGASPATAAPTATPFAVLRERPYWRCPDCALTWMDPSGHPQPADERARYDEHNNDPDDPGYCAFLRRLADPLLARLAPGAAGLDYGSGPAPVMAELIRAAGHPVALYDPYYAPDPAPLEARYAFIVCCETAEHFHRPRRDFDRLAACLQPGGTLALMTCTLTDDARFPTWWYTRDPTHVVFYRPETYAWIARHYGWRAETLSKDVTFFTGASA